MLDRYAGLIAVTVSITACSVPIYVQQELADEEFSYVRVRGDEGDAAAKYRFGTRHGAGLDTQQDQALVDKWFQLEVEGVIREEREGVVAQREVIKPILPPVPTLGHGGSVVEINRVGPVRPLHTADRGRAVFADVMLVGEDRVLITYQLAGFDEFCQGKSLYFQELNRELVPVRAESQVIDVTVAGSIFRPTQKTAGDLGDHKFTVMNDTIFMVTTVPGEVEGRILRFDTSFNLIDDIFDDGSLSRVGDERLEDRLLDMGFASDGTYLYVQFFNQPMVGGPSDWGAQIYKLNASLGVVGDAVVYPEGGPFVTGTSIVHLPQGTMGTLEDRLQIFSPNKDYGNSDPSNIHTFTVKADDLTLIQGSTRVITDTDLDVYFPTGADWNEEHHLWVVGYTQEIAPGIHGSIVSGADACASNSIRPSGEEYRELGPSFISVFNAQWSLIDTIALNDGDYAFRVMLETEGDDIYVVYDEMDLYAWHESSQAKLERFRITTPSIDIEAPVIVSPIEAVVSDVTTGEGRPNLDDVW